MKQPVFLGLIFMAIMSRLALPPFFGHSANFAPMDAIALFSGAYMGRKFIGFLAPLFAIWISDVLVNFSYYHHLVLFYEGFYWQYISYIFIVVLGSTILKEIKISRVLAGSLLASLLFFLLSNFGVFTGGIYPHTVAGLGACYLAALPFFSHTILSDLIYGVCLFGLYEAVKHYIMPLLPAAARGL